MSIISIEIPYGPISIWVKADLLTDTIIKKFLQ